MEAKILWVSYNGIRHTAHCTSYEGATILSDALWRSGAAAAAAIYKAFATAPNGWEDAACSKWAVPGWEKEFA